MNDVEFDVYQNTILRGRNLKLLRKIKDGSCDSFVGRHETFNKDVFVKFVPIPYDQEKSVEAEVNALVCLRDKKHVVNVIDAFYDKATDSYLVIITDYLPGQTLDKACGLNGISVHKAMDIVSDILCGLSSFHKDGLVHRDLKLENIILVEGSPVIVDLGSVKKVDSKVCEDDPITFLYRSPEIFHELKYGYKSDLYQVGLLLFQLINGKLPLEYEAYARASKKGFDENNVIKQGKAQIVKMASQGKLVEIIDESPVYCSQISRIVSNALTLRYKTVDHFYKDVYKVKSSIPDWSASNTTSKDYVCEGWRNGKYKIVPEPEGFRIVKIGIFRNRDLRTVANKNELNRYFRQMK